MIPATSTTTRVVEVDPQSEPRWTEFLEHHPDALIYHHPCWLEALQAEYGEQNASLACEDRDGAFRGVLPLFRSSGFLTGRRLVSLPRTPVAGPLVTEADVTAKLLRAAIERANGSSLELTLKVPGPRLHGLVEGLDGRATHWAYDLRLPANEAELRFGDSRNHARLKWAVNKAAKAGVVVRQASSEAEIAAWYPLYLEAMRDHIVPPRPYRFFLALWRILRPDDRMQLLIAERRGGEARVLAGSLFLIFGDTMTYAFNGRRRADLSLRPNDAILWHAIHDACRRGLRRFDFGEVDAANKGLADFKRKWVNEPRRTYRYDFPPSNARSIARRYATGRTNGIPATVWQRMPLSVTAWAGDFIYRYA